MEKQSIVAEICDQAEDFLAGVTRRDEAAAGIAEWLTIHHLKLPPDEKKLIAAEALTILEREKFFDRAAGGEDEEV